jgi:hypothetical protein
VLVRNFVIRSHAGPTSMPKGDDQAGIGELKKLGLHIAEVSELRQPFLKAVCRDPFSYCQPL